MHKSKHIPLTLTGRGPYLPFRGARVVETENILTLARCRYPILFSLFTTLLTGGLLYAVWLFVSHINLPHGLNAVVRTFMTVAVPVILLVLNAAILFMWLALGNEPLLIIHKSDSIIELPRYNKSFNLADVKNIVPVSGQQRGTSSSSPWTTGPGSGGGPSLKTELQLIVKENDRESHWHILSSSKTFDTFDYIVKKVQPLILRRVKQ